MFPTLLFFKIVLLFVVSDMALTLDSLYFTALLTMPPYLSVPAPHATHPHTSQAI